MGKYLEAKSQIPLLINEYDNQCNSFKKEMDELRKDIKKVKALSDWKKNADEKIELENKLMKIQRELDDLTEKHNEELIIAEQLVNSIMVQGYIYFKKATETEPYDMDLIAKAIEYDNPQACYYYCKTVIQAALENDAMSKLEKKNCYVQLRPYLEIAKSSGIPTAKYLYIKSLCADSTIESSRTDLEMFLEELLNAKKNPNFDNSFVKDCAILIDAINEELAALPIKQEEEPVLIDEFDYRDVDNWTVDFVKANPELCMNIVRKDTEFTKLLIEQGEYSTSNAGFDRIITGLLKLDSAGVIDATPYFAVISYAHALVFMVKMDNRNPVDRRNISKKLLENMKEYGLGNLQKKSVILIKAIDSGISFKDFSKKYTPDFPYDVIELLNDTLEYMW